MTSQLSAIFSRSPSPTQVAALLTSLTTDLALAPDTSFLLSDLGTISQSLTDLQPELAAARKAVLGLRWVCGAGACFPIFPHCPRLGPAWPGFSMSTHHPHTSPPLSPPSPPTHPHLDRLPPTHTPHPSRSSVVTCVPPLSDTLEQLQTYTGGNTSYAVLASSATASLSCVSSAASLAAALASSQQLTGNNNNNDIVLVLVERACNCNILIYQSVLLQVHSTVFSSICNYNNIIELKTVACIDVNNPVHHPVLLFTSFVCWLHVWASIKQTPHILSSHPPSHSLPYPPLPPTFL